ncbi:hypothetical protein [Variovorax sp. RA8]|uniref:hypothetical protein n=1 Tax=Variovorax sp. (strain JCM 16519 / RA8) TaxID=662548 RepID=UPI000A4A9C26|nr:hypothetical protein [Variovorax sp. RA8]VTU44274.1 hypothetical protein RA8P2_00112 [Variovorax sp. RA8]
MTAETGPEDLKNALFLHSYGDFKTYRGSLLGDGVGASEGAWWIAVADMRMVYEFYPMQAKTDPETGMLLVHDFQSKRTFDQLRDEGEARIFFWAARDPRKLIGLMRAILLLIP